MIIRRVVAARNMGQEARFLVAYRVATKCLVLNPALLWCPISDKIDFDTWFGISSNDYRYYLIFVNDFSKYLWLYLLYNHFDVFQIFMVFKNKVENLLGKKIKILHFDGDDEFMSHQFQSFLAYVGISHQLLCPHTPEHNSIAERKHHHIIETKLGLLAHFFMPPSY